MQRLPLRGAGAASAAAEGWGRGGWAGRSGREQLAQPPGNGILHRLKPAQHLFFLIADQHNAKAAQIPALLVQPRPIEAPVREHVDGQQRFAAKEIHRNPADGLHPPKAQGPFPQIVIPEMIRPARHSFPGFFGALRRICIAWKPALFRHFSAPTLPEGHILWPSTSHLRTVTPYGAPVFRPAYLTSPHRFALRCTHVKKSKRSAFRFASLTLRTGRLCLVRFASANTPRLFFTPYTAR